MPVLPALPTVALTAGLMLLSGLLTACWNPVSEQVKQAQGSAEVNAAIEAFKRSDPGIQAFFDTAYGYAVFPTVGKGGIGVGGAYGEGLVYRQGQLIGSASLVQATIGFQLGGQAYREIIFFKDPPALSRLTRNQLEFSAQASAVIATAGAAATADFHEGIAVFTLPKGGLMYEASIGGQKFNFTPLQ